ncbi:MAG TPA: DUF1329 domain-containing protein [Usitatibacteraceae bacterium]|nr:DUF1329 domain-containing protein [Usitatibacteraceae bacterium]
MQMAVRAPGCALLRAIAALLSLAAPAALAAISADELKELGTSATSKFTPMGAERAGNAAGTIPAWDGGLKEAPTGTKFERGKSYGDPFPNDKPLFTISSENWEKYKDNLSPGQIAMLKQYPTFKMPVYPSRRTALFPQKHYEQTRECAQKAVLAADNNGVTGCKGGVPFPLPKNGYEVMWNHNLRYWGDTFETQFVHIAPTRAGDYTATDFEFQADFHYGNLTLPAADVIPNRRVNYMQTVTGPARLAGEVILIHENVDFSKEARSAWIYNPGQRRVRLAPTVAYDNPIVGADGQRTVDDGFMFNGSLDRYDWKLVGKKEMYVPYNSYKLSSNTLKYTDVIRPGHLNPEHLRYELHRMWVVEATLKPGTSHLYAKRVMYVDEDSWMVTLTDKYDARGALWRTAENHSVILYDMNLFFPTADVHYDILNGRYIAMGLRNEKSTFYMPTKKTAADFTPQALRGLGVR